MADSIKKLAVLMPTYNAAAFLNESIDSVLNQTFADFDFYIYDDCSTDNTTDIISEYKDNRIFYIKNETNLGISKTLNLGLKKLLPHYQFIARMDADDWSFPERFQKQLNFLDQNQEYAFCGTQGYWLKNMDENPSSGWTYPINFEYIKLYLLFAASFGHSSIILRSQSFFENDFLYNDKIKTCEDWELWIEVAKKFPIANLPDFMMKYRIVSDSNHRSTDKQKIHLQERSHIISNYWKTFNIELSTEQIFEYYYNFDNEIHVDFYFNLKNYISIFNILFKTHANALNNSDRYNFSYLLARKILDYRKRCGQSRYNFQIWYLIFKNAKFMSYYRLFKSQIN